MKSRKYKLKIHLQNGKNQDPQADSNHNIDADGFPVQTDFHLQENHE